MRMRYLSSGSFCSPQTYARKRSDRVLILVATGTMMALFVVSLIILNFKSASAVQSRLPEIASPQASSLGTVTLFTPARNVSAGMRLSEVAIKETYWPTNQVPLDAIRDVSELSGYYAIKDIAGDVPLRRSHLTSQKPISELGITPGNRAVSMEVSDSTSVEGFTRPGTRVDVALTWYRNEKLVTQLIVQNSKVLSAGGDSSIEASSLMMGHGKSVRTVTLDVSVQDGLKIMLGKQSGQLSLMMRASVDDKTALKTTFDQNEVAGNTQKAQTKVGCQLGTLRTEGREFQINCDNRISELVSEPVPVP